MKKKFTRYFYRSPYTHRLTMTEFPIQLFEHCIKYVLLEGEKFSKNYQICIFTHSLEPEKRYTQLYKNKEVTRADYAKLADALLMYIGQNNRFKKEK